MGAKKSNKPKKSQKATKQVYDSFFGGGSALGITKKNCIQCERSGGSRPNRCFFGFGGGWLTMVHLGVSSRDLFQEGGEKNQRLSRKCSLKKKESGIDGAQ